VSEHYWDITLNYYYYYYYYYYCAAAVKFITRLSDKCLWLDLDSMPQKTNIDSGKPCGLQLYPTHKKLVVILPLLS